jgi:hypothetical protein
VLDFVFKKQFLYTKQDVVSSRVKNTLKKLKHSSDMIEMVPY